jgi:HEAT repeat protein
MSLLFIIWLAALGLMTFALTAMSALIVARLLRERRRAKRAARRSAILPEIVNHIGGLSAGPLNLMGMERDAVLMASVVRDLAGLVRGDERTRMMTALCALNVDRALLTLLRHGSTNQRVLAAEALVFFPDATTKAELLNAGRHGAPRLRQAALRSAIEIGAAPPLSELLDSVISRPERASLLFSDLLQRATRSQIEEAIAALARMDLPRSVRLMLMAALGATRDPRALAPLMEAAQAQDGEIRAGAFAALSALGHPDARACVGAGLADPDWRVRLKAIECVRKLRLTAFVPALQTCAADEIWWVRYRAGEALIAIAEQDIAKLKSLLAQFPEPLPAPEKAKPKPARKRAPKAPAAEKPKAPKAKPAAKHAPAKPKSTRAKPAKKAAGGAP